MSERERWIVYPLLFLALGAALRDKLSEETHTKRIECQELIVVGEERAGRPPVPLVQIGEMQRTSANAPHVGQIVINGQLVANGIHANSIDADNYSYHQIGFGPTLRRAVPGISPWLRAWQQSAEGSESGADPAGQPVKGDDSAQPPANSPPSNPPPASDKPPAE